VSMRLGRSKDSKHNARVGRARSDVVGGLIFFVLLQLLLAVGIETFVPQVRDPLYGCRLARVRRRLRSCPVKPFTVVMLGSSRTQNGFRVGLEEKGWGEALGRPVAAFNFGVAGGGPLTELLTWRRLDHNGVRPDLLLVEATPPLLNGQIPAGDYAEDHLPTAKLSWQDLPLVKRYAGRSRAGLTGDWLRCWPLPWYTHRLSLVSRVRPELLPGAWRLDLDWNVDEYGGLRFIEAPVTPELRRKATQSAREDYQPRLAKFHLGGPQCEALRELLASCRRENVPVALVLTPEGPTFRSWYPPETWGAIQEWLTRVSQEFDAPLVNAREWIDDENNFMDSHHLLKSGADKFTDRLGRETILPMLRRASPSSP
jgi:hypothetical protein